MLKTDNALRCRLLERIRECKVVLIADENPVLYAGVYCNAEGLTLVVGPVSLVTVDQSFMKLYASKHHAQHCQLQCYEAEKLSSAVLIVCSGNNPDKITVNQLLEESLINKDLKMLTHKRMAEVFSRIALEGTPHAPLSCEQGIRRAVSAGDEEQLKKALDTPVSGAASYLAVDELRSARKGSG